MIRIRSAEKVHPDARAQDTFGNGLSDFLRAEDGCRLMAAQQVVAEACQILDVIPVPVRDEHVVNPGLLFEGETSGQATGVNGQRVVHQHGSEAPMGGLALVGADDSNFHDLYPFHAATPGREWLPRPASPGDAY